MPQHRVILIVEKSPPERHELPVMDEPLAQQVKHALDPAKGSKVLDVRIEKVAD
ncbi:MAG: hypothetical protein M3304_02405 [Actinomycetota bacterium]|nr:hypothetical protein [Actinomycetota bacterium]